MIFIRYLYSNFFCSKTFDTLKKTKNDHTIKIRLNGRSFMK